MLPELDPTPTPSRDVLSKEKPPQKKTLGGGLSSITEDPHPAFFSPKNEGSKVLGRTLVAPSQLFGGHRAAAPSAST